MTFSLARKNLRLLLCLAFLAAALPQLKGGPAKQNLFPKLRAGQSLAYLIRFRNDKQVRTQSSVVTAAAPNGEEIDVHGLLLIDVLNVQPAGARAVIRARSHFQALDSGASPKRPGQNQAGGQAQPSASEDKFVEFTLLADGTAKDMEGLDALPPELQRAWQEWFAQFAIAAIFPPEGVSPGEKWKSEEAEKSPAPIAGLQWIKEGNYVRDEPCAPMRMNIQGEAQPSAQRADICAVILTRASLKQKSSTNDATPEDYKLHELRTMGTARGTNEVITYISLKTGLVLRATEEADQFMDVNIALADGSNRVHYNVDAKSQAEVLLVTEIPLNPSQVRK
jgi:hypothetical protein